MYFALLIVIALVVAALVLFLEHRAERRLLEREDGAQATISKKTSLK